ncbi:MAG: AraC family transcriptional regulator, partial [Chloroflexi bacterium]|nr:AraC family transcriptional regulator [Chloroflexota bacterium]
MPDEQANYLMLPPRPELAGLIACFWALCAPASAAGVIERLPASGRVELMLHYAGESAQYPADLPGGSPVFQTHRQVNSRVIGVRSQGYCVEHSGPTDFVAVRFKPGGLAAFTNFALEEITDQSSGLIFVFGREGAELEEQIYEAADPIRQLEILEAALLARFNPPQHHQRILHARDLIMQAEGDLAVRWLADEVGLSQRQFNRLFKQIIGIGPKRFSRITRFYRALLYA